MKRPDQATLDRNRRVVDEEQAATSRNSIGASAFRGHEPGESDSHGRHHGDAFEPPGAWSYPEFSSQIQYVALRPADIFTPPLENMPA
jgi:hypothetical protein